PKQTTSSQLRGRHGKNDLARSARATPAQAATSHGAQTMAAMYCTGRSCVSTTRPVTTAESQPSERGSEPCRMPATASEPEVSPMPAHTHAIVSKMPRLAATMSGSRAEERRVGKEGRSRGTEEG